MNRLTGAIALALVVSYGAVSAQQSGDRCNGVLVKTVVDSSENRARTYAYVLANAGMEYERLRNLEANQRSADLSYKVFSTEYSDSTSSEQFREKVAERASVEQFNLNETESRSRYRTGVSDAQVMAWTACMVQGGILLTASNVDQQSFTLKATWQPQPGVQRERLDLQLQGGTINGQSGIGEEYGGPTSKTYIVTRQPAGARVLAIANIASLTDAIQVPVTLSLPVRSSALSDIAAFRMASPQQPYAYAGYKDDILRLSQLAEGALIEPLKLQGPGTKQAVRGIADQLVRAANLVQGRASRDLPQNNQYYNWHVSALDGYKLHILQYVTLTERSGLTPDIVSSAVSSIAKWRQAVVGP